MPQVCLYFSLCVPVCACVRAGMLASEMAGNMVINTGCVVAPGAGTVVGKC